MRPRMVGSCSRNTLIDMQPATNTVLYRVKEALEGTRTILDDHMYRSGGIPDEDHDYCRKVYDRICKALDLL